MIAMVEFTFPAAKAEEVAKAYVDEVQANPIPDYVKIVEMYQLFGGEGIKGYAYYDLAKGNEEEGMKYIIAHELGMTKAIDGYKMQPPSVVYPLAESYTMLGVAPPAL